MRFSAGKRKRSYIFLKPEGYKALERLLSFDLKLKNKKIIYKTAF